jgi:hypothetical protein
MKKLKLEVEALAVESFEPAGGGGEGGTVRGYLTAYYELCYPGDTWQASCTCELTCNARTCFNCPGPSAGCNTPTGNCCLINFTVDPTSCQPDC